jgi:hypothetical protein
LVDEYIACAGAIASKLTPTEKHSKSGSYILFDESELARDSISFDKLSSDLTLSRASSLLQGERS